MSTDPKHCYPGTDVLINKHGFQDPKVLKDFETTVTYQRQLQLEIKPIFGKFDLNHFCKIHHHIFQDVYPFAGKIRDVVIAKGSTVFAYPQYLLQEGERIFTELKAENNLRGLDVATFSERAAFYLSEINMLHPTREGNGRTQREFIRCLGLNAGYLIDWTRVEPDTYMNAFISSVKDPSAKELANVLDTCIINREPEKDLIRFFEVSKTTRSQDVSLER